jgi:hypothetical protein
MFVHHETLKFPALKQKNLPIGRVYEVAEGPLTGRFYPSITRVLAAAPKPQLDAWKARVGPVEAARQSSEAARRGTSIHALAESYVANDPLPAYTPVVGELWSHLRPLLDQRLQNIYAMEQNVYSDKLAVAGRLDLLGEWDGVLSIIDFKNSKKPKQEEWDAVQSYFIQGAFYALAVYELTGAKAKQIVLPIVSPQQIQVFIQPVAKYLHSLVEKIDYFYVTYEKELDTLAMA